MEADNSYFRRGTVPKCSAELGNNSVICFINAIKQDMSNIILYVFLAVSHESINKLGNFFITLIVLVIPILVANIITLYRKRKPSRLRFGIFSTLTLGSVLFHIPLFVAIRDYITTNFSIIMIFLYVVIIILYSIYLRRYLKDTL